MAMRGHMLTEEQKLDFLEHTRQGHNRHVAARMVGGTGSQFRQLCSEKSTHYDERFARVYREIHETGEFEENRLELLRGEAMIRALADSDRLIEKFLLLYDPDWQPLRTQRIDVNANIEAWAQNALPNISKETLDRVISELEQEKKELPSGGKDLPPDFEGINIVNGTHISGPVPEPGGLPAASSEEQAV